MSEEKRTELSESDENMLEISRSRENQKEEDREAQLNNQMASLDADMARHDQDRSQSKSDYPDDFEDRYFTKEGKRGTTVYADSKGEEELFKDTGDKLTSKNPSELAVKAMMETAKHRDWDQITVRGSEKYRREAWFEGETRRIKVKGYKPNELDMQELKHRQKQHPGIDIAPEKRELAKADQTTHERGETRSGLPESDAKEKAKRELVEAVVQRSIRQQFPNSPEQVEKGMSAVRKFLDERAERGEKLPDVQVRETREVAIEKNDRKTPREPNVSPQNMSMDQLKQNVKREEQDKDMEKTR